MACIARLSSPAAQLHKSCDLCVSSVNFVLCEPHAMSQNYKIIHIIFDLNQYKLSKGKRRWWLLWPFPKSDH